ncbi:MAG TPA: nucleotidyltransferase domain-containing protein [Anaerolinea sp.]|nr:nucleotidyltransferase domain-containing protein [Anaerolinea sp.]
MDADTLIDLIAGRVKQVDGLRALVLGGSRARGTHRPDSDIDLGFYYHPSRPLDLRALGEIAAELDDTHRPDLLTPLGGWGPWINGGGWLKVQGTAVDFLYRDLQKIHDLIEACLAGQVEIHYQPGHPFGFLSSTYLAEIAVCKVLWDPFGDIAALKAQVEPYPAVLQKTLVDKFLWEIDFALSIAHKSIGRGDVTYAAGCCFQAASCILQVLFALNRQHWLNEKGALALAETFAVRPADLKARVERAFGLLSADGSAIQAAIDRLGEVAAETQALV